MNKLQKKYLATYKTRKKKIKGYETALLKENADTVNQVFNQYKAAELKRVVPQITKYICGIIDKKYGSEFCIDLPHECSFDVNLTNSGNYSLYRRHVALAIVNFYNEFIERIGKCYATNNLHEYDVNPAKISPGLTFSAYYELKRQLRERGYYVDKQETSLTELFRPLYHKRSKIAWYRRPCEELMVTKIRVYVFPRWRRLLSKYLRII